jgi:hypothetical protein
MPSHRKPSEATSAAASWSSSKAGNNPGMTSAMPGRIPTIGSLEKFAVGTGPDEYKQLVGALVVFFEVLFVNDLAH